MNIQNKLQKLKEPFPERKVKWRIQHVVEKNKSGLALAYADARAFMDRLDNVLGAENWQDKYDFGKGGETVCSVGIKVNEEWIWKTDGAGQTQIEGEKGGMSDAFKRACVKWGIGRYLYKLDEQWVDVKKQGKSWVIKKDSVPSLPKWAVPDKEKYICEIRKLYKKNKSQVHTQIMNFLKENNYSENLANMKKLDSKKAKTLLDKIKEG